MQVETLVATPSLLGSFILLRGGPLATTHVPNVDLIPYIAPAGSAGGLGLSDQVYKQGWTTAQVVDGQVTGGASRQTQAFRIVEEGRSQPRLLWQLHAMSC